MFQFIAWRIVQLPLILAIIYLVTFLLVWVAPGNPFEQTDRKLDERTLQQKKERLHADSALSFLGYYPLLLLRGEFGESLNYEEWSVTDIIRASLPVSVTLGLLGITIATFIGVAIGAAAAASRGGAVDWLSLTIALIGISLPGFVTASLLLMIFAVELKWFPAGGWGTFSGMILPGIAIALLPMAYIARLTRVAMIDVLGSDYIRTARAKGLSRTKVVLAHGLRNAMLPVLGYIGPAAAYTLTGSFVVEKVFNIPGLGQHFVNSVLNRDQTLILGVVMVYAAFLLIFNLLVDIGYAVVDPRVELATSG